MQKVDSKAHIRYPPILPNTFEQYLAHLTKSTENNVSVALPKLIALIFDGQTQIDANYDGLAFTYSFPKCNGFESVCLAMSLMEADTTQTVYQYILGVSLTL